MLDWLIITNIDLFFLIAVVLLIRPIVRQLLGANVSYWLWLIPALRFIMPERLTESTASPFAANQKQFSLIMEWFPLVESYLTNTSQFWIVVWLFGFFVVTCGQLFRFWRTRIRLRQHSHPIPSPSKLFPTAQSPTVQSPTVQSPPIESLRDFSPNYLNRLQFFSTSVFGAPLVTGLFRPKVYLPKDFSVRFSPDEQRLMIMHEIAHIRRGDLWLQFFAESARAICWFNPMVHFAVSYFRRDQEYACDYLVLRNASKQDKIYYGFALLRGVNGSSTQYPTFYTSCKERFRILNNHQFSLVKSVLGLCLCIALAFILLVY